MDDGAIVWRPTHGTRSQIKIDAIATVLLAVKGPTEKYDIAAIGDSSGGVTLLSLPRLEVIEKFAVEGGIVRSLTAVTNSFGKYLAATQNGSVWVVGTEVPNRAIKLFTHTGPITSLRLIDDSIIIQSGWNRRTYDWTGETTNDFDGAQQFAIKATHRANRRARILESEQRRKEQSQPLMLDLPSLA
tara:strand:- start:1192 stop:1752 length:561 start_codon:yes stop_codon:yes gene_type:complete